VRALRLHDTGDLRLHDWPERLAHTLPDGLSDVEGSLLVDLGGLVSARYALSEWRDAFDDLVERRRLKVVLEPQQAGG
jgi:hypothetical protein